MSRPEKGPAISGLEGAGEPPTRLPVVPLKEPENRPCGSPRVLKGPENRPRGPSAQSCFSVRL